jgi:uncharacterized protein (TIGR02996 family)
MLGRALERLDGGDDEGCLRDLLAAWRVDLSPEIADAIDLVSARITKARGPIVAKTVEARTALWMQVQASRDPGDVERLLATPWPGRWIDAMPLLEQIALWPSDPRVAMALARIAHDLPYETTTCTPFYATLLEHLARIEDLRVLSLLGERTYQECPRAYLSVFDVERHIVVHLREREALGRPPSDPVALERLRERFKNELAARTKSTRGDQDFVAAILSDPNDDDVRPVYADFLCEEGDPRGEFIALQLRRATSAATFTEAMKHRERTLLAKYERTWLGVLARWVDFDAERRFERGFLVRASLKSGVINHRDDVLSRLEWSTLRVLDVRYLSSDQIARIMAAPMGRHLEGFSSVEESAATWLARGIETPSLAQRFCELGVMLAHLPVDRVALASADGLPSLRRLDLTPPFGDEDPAWIASGPLWQRLEHLVVRLVHLAPWVRSARASTSLRTVEIVTGEWKDGRWRATFVDDARGARLRSVRLEWESGIVRAPHQVPTLETLLLAISNLEMSEVVVAPSRTLRPTFDERRELELALGRFETVQRLEVPWDREPSRPSTDVCALQVDLVGRSLLPHLRELLDDLSRAELGPTFDTFIVNHGISRPAGKDPTARILAWTEKSSTRSVAFFRESMRGASEVTLNQSGDDAVEGAIEEWTRQLVLPTSQANFVFGAPPASHEDHRVYIERFLSWVCALLDRYPIAWGRSRFPTGNLETSVLGLLSYTPNTLGWLTIFGEHHATLFPRSALERLPSELEAEGIRDVSIRTTKRNVLLVCGNSPDVDDAIRLQAVERRLLAILRRSFVEKYGYDLYDGVRDALAPIAYELGFDRVLETPATRTTEFLLRRGDYFDICSVRISNAICYPLFSVHCRTEHVTESGDPLGAHAMAWRREEWLRCPSERSGNWPAPTKAIFDDTIANIAERLRAMVDPSFDVER